MRTIPMTVQAPARRIPRRAQRYPVRWAVLEINGKPVRDSWVVDVSVLGARLETTAALGPNLSVKFCVLLPDGDTEIEFSGRVMWMRPLFMRPGYFHQGLQFYGAHWDLERVAKTWPP